MQDYSLLSAKKALSALDSSIDGLSVQEAQKRLNDNGLNQLSEKEKQSFLKKVIEPFKSLFVTILLVASVISFFAGKIIDMIVILAIVILNAIIYYAQKFSTEKVLNTLKQHEKRFVHVKRDKKLVQIESIHLVPGDIIVLNEGQKIPADGRIIETDNLHIDESIITGESLPVEKTDRTLERVVPIYDMKNMLFSGTFVQSGSATMLATHTGNKTEYGRIATMAKQEERQSPLQQKVNSLTSKLVIIVSIVVIIALILNIVRGSEFLEAIRFAMAMAVSAIPEGLPVAITVVLVLGIGRMAKKQALVRNMTAIETLGRLTYITTDKTGTITTNRLSLADWWEKNNDEDRLLKSGWLALAQQNGVSNEPLEHVIKTYGEKFDYKGYKHIKSIPFLQDMRLSGSTWQYSGKKITYIKGAPESIIEYCKIDTTEKEKIKKIIHSFSQRGYRLIAIAKKETNFVNSKFDRSSFVDFDFSGILAFSDKLREEVPQAVREAQQAKINVLLLTGDHLQTAKHIAIQAKIASEKDLGLEGQQIIKNSPRQIYQKLKKIKVLARVLPEHKYIILQALSGKEITAMTGDGINDIPALVKSDVGVAIGSGTDAAKEASDMILIDNNFATIVRAIREGRTIVNNIRKMITYLFATNLGEVITILSALIIGLPLPITAIQVLWINFVTDGVTVIPLGLEPPEKNIMKECPEKPNRPILDKKMIYRVFFTAITMATITLIVFVYYLPNGLDQARSMAFLTLVVVQWANAINNRSQNASFVEGIFRPNLLLLASICLALILQILIFATPLSQIFNVVSINYINAIVVSAISIAIVLISGDILKKIFR